MTRISGTLFALALALLVALTTTNSSAATRFFVVGNNNTSPTNSVSVFQVSGTSLVHVTTVPTGGSGTGGGYFAEAQQSIAQDGANICIFAGDGGSGDIAAMKIISASPYLSVVSNYFSPDGDTASSFGLGITVSGGFLYANYTGGATSPAIGIWKVGAGCTLTYVKHLQTTGMNGGTIDGLVATPNGNFLVAAYGDGSVGSYAIGGGNIALVGQEIIAGNSVGAGAYAGSVAVSKNGDWAIFGDFSPSNTTQLDVAAIAANGALAPTTTYGGTGTLGNGIDTNGIQLSPDNRFIYVVDSYSGQETTVAFNSTTGVVSYPNPCLTSLRGYNTNFLFASQAASVSTTGAGTGLYISEGFLTGDSYIALLGVSQTTGCAAETPNSPFVDTAGNSLESIASFIH